MANQYFYVARVFSHQDYRNLLYVHEQEVLCLRPPDEILRKPRPREP